MRSKIITLLFRKTIDVMDELSVNTVARLIRLFAVNCKNARDDTLLNMLEPYVLNRVNGMNEWDLFEAVKGYHAFGDPQYEALVTLEKVLYDAMP